MNESDNITPSEPQSMTPPSPVYSSLPPSPVHSFLPPSPVNSSLPPSPVHSSLPPSPVHSSLPPSPVFSSLSPSPIHLSLPPLSPSPSSFRPGSLRSTSLSPSLLRDYSPSPLVENGDSSISFNEDPSSPPSGGAGKDIEPLSRHYRSVSLDSCFYNFLNLPPSPSTVSSTSSVDGDENSFDLEFENDEYTADELKKISKSSKLTEVASDPKTVRSILANRESATLSKKRKSKYVIDLEHRQKFLENENTLMSKKIKLLEKDKTMIMNERKEIRIRLESLKQEAQLHDEIESQKAKTTLKEQVSVEAQRLKEVTASNERLIVEIQRLKMATGEVMQNHSQFDESNIHHIDTNMFQQLTINEFNQPDKPCF